MGPLRGSFRVLILYDIAEQIELDNLRGILGAEPPRREPSFKHPSPEYVRFERPPVVGDTGPVAAATGEQFQSRIKYFDYGVAIVELQLSFEAGWDDLVRLSNRWISAPEIEKCAADLLRKHLERSQAALIQPYDAWLNEDYYAIQLTDALDDQGRPMTGAALLERHGGQIAQIVRGESQPLADTERQEVLQSAMSYYPHDLLVAGWVAALIYDTPEGATPALQLLEYANSQLLEFRHYDEVLTKVLASAYQLLEHRGGILRRWRMAREAERLNALRLDVMELTERTDNAIKFLSDMFYARAYRAAAHRVGVTDYRNLVDEKLRTAGELYESMVSEFHEARSFVLELLVIAILVIELVQVFRGGH
jgi:hypothetical protein